MNSLTVCGTTWIGIKEWAGVESPGGCDRMKIKFSDGDEAAIYYANKQSFYEEPNAHCVWRQDGNIIYVGTYSGSGIAWEFTGTTNGHQISGTEIELSDSLRRWVWILHNEIDKNRIGFYDRIDGKPWQIKSLDFQGKTFAEANGAFADTNPQIPPERIFDQQILLPHTRTSDGKGKDLDAAIDDAKERLSSSTYDVHVMKVSKEDSGGIEIQAQTEAEARQEALKKKPHGTSLDSITCVIKPQEGVLGLGKRPGKWRAHWVRFIVTIACMYPATISIKYKDTLDVQNAHRIEKLIERLRNESTCREASESLIAIGSDVMCQLIEVQQEKGPAAIAATGVLGEIGSPYQPGIATYCDDDVQLYHELAAIGKRERRETSSSPFSYYPTFARLRARQIGNILYYLGKSEFYLVRSAHNYIREVLGERAAGELDWAWKGIANGRYQV